MTPAALPKITESEFQAQVIALARLRGWLVAHFRPARTADGWRTPVAADGKGFPDLVLVHPVRGRLLVAELKVGGNKLSADQEKWVAAFLTAEVAARVWRPADWPEIEATLA